MNDEFLQKRISRTVSDIYPLDRILPIETVYSIFAQAYSQSNDRNLFFRERKFQRLREGYFSLFVAISLLDISGKPHYLVFPSEPENDVYFTYTLDGDKNKFGAYRFDIKEFTNFSNSFADFIKKNIAPKIDIYNLAISTYRKIDEQDIQLLITFLKDRDATNKIWLVGSPTEEDLDKNISKVAIINKEGILYDKTINLDDWIDKKKPIIIFQDLIRFKFK